VRVSLELERLFERRQSCCEGYVAGESETHNQLLIEPLALAGVDPIEELIRAVNEAQERSPETNVAFMRPRSGTVSIFSRKTGQITFCGAPPLPAAPIARLFEAPQTFNCRVGPETLSYFNLMVVKISIIPAIECNRWI
jgi:hypothetical protein